MEEMVDETLNWTNCPSVSFLVYAGRFYCHYALALLFPVIYVSKVMQQYLNQTLGTWMISAFEETN